MVLENHAKSLIKPDGNTVLQMDEVTSTEYHFYATNIFISGGMVLSWDDFTVKYP